MSASIRAQLVASLRAQRALFVAGAGLTIGATGRDDASWTGLLESGLTRCADLSPDLRGEWLQRHLKYLDGSDPSDLLEAASAVTAQLKAHPGNQFGRWLRETVGSFAADISDSSVPELLASFAVPIATTSYDDVLANVSKRTPVSHLQPALMQQELNDPGQHILHLHGHWREPESLVFGYESYSRAIGHAASQELLRSFSTIQQMVFVGFGAGLRDPNFQALGTWLRTTLATSNENAPIALVPDAELDRASRLGKQLGFIALSYGTHADLATFLSDIHRDVGRQPSNTPRTPIEYEWGTIFNKLRRLARRIERTYSPDFVLSMSGPGCFAAAHCLAQMNSDPPLMSAVTFPKLPHTSSLASAFGKVAGEADWIHIETTRWHIYIPNTVRHFEPGSKALVLDDRVIGGSSQRRARELLEGLDYRVKTAALVVHPARQSTVDFYEEVIEHDFVFPWGGKYGRNEPPI